MTEDDKAFEQWSSILFDPETDEDDDTTTPRPLFALPLLAAVIGYISHDVVYRTADIPLTLDILWSMAIGGGVGLWFVRDVVEWIERRYDRLPIPQRAPPGTVNHIDDDPHDPVPGLVSRHGDHVSSGDSLHQRGVVRCLRARGDRLDGNPVRDGRPE